VGKGLGYRLQTAVTDREWSGNSALQYQTAFGRYEMQFDPFHTSRRPTITAAGGMVYQGSSLLLTRPVQESFALVRVPGVPNVRVYSSNELVGRTNERGDLLVPNLLAYYGNRLRIDDRDVPMHYQIVETEMTIAPPFRGGAVVTFPVRQIRTVTGSVVIRTKDGEVVPVFGELRVEDGKDVLVSPIGHGGEFYLENVAAGGHDATVEYPKGTCAFKLQVPEQSDPVLKLGRLICTSEAVKP
jgi:outer membrane usher protein